jgi:tetratricopeptide (TPR) repeat protein
MARRVGFPFVVLLLLTASTPAWSQGGTAIGSIVGIARVIRGNFPEPILVNLQLHGATIASSYTDSEGRFNFSMVTANLYKVVINDERYTPVSVDVNVRPDLIPVSYIQVSLMPRSANAATPSGLMVVSSDELARKYPKNAVKEFERGVKLENEGKADDAIDHYRKATKEAPNFAPAHNNLGSLYVGKSDFPEAKKEFEQSMRLDPGDSKAYFNMANLMLLTGKLEDAERYLQDGFRKQPDSAFGFFVQGSVMERTGRLPDAERALRHALELNPKMTRPHLELVNLYLRAQRPTDAIAELRKFLAIAPSDAFAPKAREVLQKLESGAAAR